MDTLTYKMKALDLLLVIKKLKFEDPLKKHLVGELKLLPRDPALVDNLDTNN